MVYQRIIPEQKEGAESSEPLFKLLFSSQVEVWSQAQQKLLRKWVCEACFGLLIISIEGNSTMSVLIESMGAS